MIKLIKFLAVTSYPSTGVEYKVLPMRIATCRKNIISQYEFNSTIFQIDNTSIITVDTCSLLHLQDLSLMRYISNDL